MPGDGTDWRLRSKCSRLTIADSDKLFFSKGRTSKKAKEFCKDCPVLSECLALSLTSDNSVGVWAGTSERERRKMLKQRLTLLPGSVGVVKRVNLQFHSV